MDLRDILEKCKNLTICEKRSLKEDYCELIFFREETNEWHRIFKEFFGPPVKPATSRTGISHRRLTKGIGGVTRHQTLFDKKLNGKRAIATFWPWRDGIHVTLKMKIIEEGKYSKGKSRGIKGFFKGLFGS